jgi:hypothetical protein
MKSARKIHVAASNQPARQAGARMLVLAMLCVVALAGTSQAREQHHWDVDVNVSVGVFFDALAPYGTWMETDAYGWCWVPSVVEYDVAWRPYVTGGHWVWTDCGWTWVSYYDWGWAPFHYGRWVLVGYGRWAWVPGYVWGPAWVSWRVGGGYIGWYPLSPEVSFSWDVGIRYHHPHFRSGFYYDDYPYVWSFVPAHRLTHLHVADHVIAQHSVVNIYNVTNNVTNIYYDSANSRVVDHGPDVRYVERYTKKTVPQYRLLESSKIGHAGVQKGNVIELYNPSLQGSAALKKSEAETLPDSDLLIQSKLAQKAFTGKYERAYKKAPTTPMKVLTKVQIDEAKKEGFNLLSPEQKVGGKMVPSRVAPGPPARAGLREQIGPVAPQKTTLPAKRETGPLLRPGEKKVIAPGKQFQEPSEVAPGPKVPTRLDGQVQPGAKVKKQTLAPDKKSGIEEESFLEQPKPASMKPTSPPKDRVSPMKRTEMPVLKPALQKEAKSPETGPQSGLPAGKLRPGMQEVGGKKALTPTKDQVSPTPLPGAPGSQTAGPAAPSAPQSGVMKQGKSKMIGPESGRLGPVKRLAPAGGVEGKKSAPSEESK